MSDETAAAPSRRFLIALAVGATLVPLNSTMVAVALPEIGKSLGVGAGSLTLWLVTSYLLVNAMLQSPAGKLGDRLGSRRAFVLGQAMFAAGTLLAVAAPVLPALGAARMLMAGGGAMMVPTAMAMLRNGIPENRRARAFGNFGALMGASAAVGPVLGGGLTRHLGWKSIFYVNWPLLLLCALLLGRERRRNGPVDHPAPAAFDLAGTLLLTLGLLGLVAGFKSRSGAALPLVGAGLVCLTAFLLWERRAAAPLLPPSFIRPGPFLAGGTIVGLSNLGMYALLFQMPFFLGDLFGLQAGESGPVLLTMTLTMVLFSSLGGRTSERLGTRATVSLGVLLGLAGLVTTMTGGQSRTMAPIVIGLALVGSGIGVVTGPAQAVALSSVPTSQSGVGAGVLSTLRYLGGIAGIGVVSVRLGAPGDAIAANLSCLKVYMAAYLVALGLAQTLPASGRSSRRRV